MEFEEIIHRAFNQAHHYTGVVENYFHVLEREEEINQEELKDLIGDAQALARRIDRLHHDYTNLILDKEIA